MLRTLSRAIVIALAISGAARAAEPAKADLVLVEKAARRLVLFEDGRPARSYSISLGGSPRGHKQHEGDERTPEGRYVIDARNPDSSFHLSLRISYPDARDQARAAAAGVDPGGLIMIHGIRNGFGWIGGLHRLFDWTDGCIAVTNSEMDEIWQRVDLGTPVEIRP